MKKTLDKLKKYWLIYRDNREAMHKAFRFAFVAWRTHRRMGWKKSFKIAKGYFFLGLGWGGFQLPGSKSQNRSTV